MIALSPTVSLGEEYRHKLFISLKHDCSFGLINWALSGACSVHNAYVQDYIYRYNMACDNILAVEGFGFTKY